MNDFRKSVVRNIVIISTMVTILGVFFVLLKKNISHELSIIKDLSSRRTMYLESSQGLATLISQWKQAQRYTNQVTALVPKKDDIALLSKELQVLGQRNNVAVTFSFSSSGSSSATTQGVGSIGFSATFDGSTSDILALIHTIEQTYYAIRIDSFDMTTNGSENSFRCLVSGQVFFSE